MTHSKDPILDSAEKPGQGRGICGGRGDTRSRRDSSDLCRRRGTLPGVADKQKPGNVNPFPLILFKVAEKCASIFLGLQGENLAEGRGGEEPPHLHISPQCPMSVAKIGFPPKKSSAAWGVELDIMGEGL